MPVNHEIKSQLAKLLATEDLIVEHRSVETAQFNVRTRVLTLPNWDYASDNVFDSLVAHEVGHALYTPDRDWWLEGYKMSPQFVNIAEDVRIEKLMKRRYGGIAKTFYRGYNELNNQDFFELDDKDLDTLNLADRVNLYFKVGSWVDISFSSIETPIVDLIKNAETFDETLSAAEALYNFCKQEQESNQETEQVSGKIVGESSTSSMEDDVDLDYNPSSDSESGSDPQGSGMDDVNSDIDNSNSDPSNPVGGTNGTNEPIAQTADSLSEALKNLNNKNNTRENTYVELPELDLNRVIINNNVIHNEIDLHWAAEIERFAERRQQFHHLPEDIFEEVDSQYAKFKRDSQKEVNYLVKEFECKKSASAYARATTAKTGVLNTSKLHTYKYNEDLFKKITVLPDGKNHGLVFVLDWSGSMAHVMEDTIKQLYHLLWFCKKVQIPFEVYAFSNDCPFVNDDQTGVRLPAYDREDYVALVEETFSLMNLFTSNVNSKTLEEQMKSVFRIACSFHYNSWVTYTIPMGMNLSGTPLNESLIALHKIIPTFQKKYNVEKVQCVILTDGEGAPLRYSKKFHRHWDGEDGFMGSNQIDDRSVIRNRKTGYSYSLQGLCYWAGVTNVLLKDLRQSFPNTNFIGIRLIGGRDANPFIRIYSEYEDRDKLMADWKKHKAINIKTSGYHSYFGLSSSALANDDEFEVKSDATKAQIKRAFFKSLKNKKMNKKILSEFVELVA